MARKPTEPTDDDGRTDEVIIAENAKIVADSQMAVAKAQIMEDNEATLERFNALTRWTPPPPKPPPTKRKRKPSTRRSASRSKSASESKQSKDSA